MRCNTIADIIGDGASIDISQTAINVYVPSLNPSFNYNSKTVLTTPYTGDVNISGLIKTNTIAANNIYDSSQSVSIDLNSTTINVVAPYLKFNGNNILYQNYPSYIQALSFIKIGGGTELLRANGTTDNKQYLESAGTQIVNSVPFIDSSGQLFSDNSNLYVPRGSSIQTAINQIISGQGYSIQLASGGYTENIVLSKQNYILNGVDSPLFTPTTAITGSITIGLLNTLTTRIKIQNILCSGNLTFYSHNINQALRIYISNCEFQSGVIFPQLSVLGGWIYFFDCTFSGTMMTFLNQTTYAIVFTRCNFSQGFTNANSVASLLTFRDCTGLVSLSIGTCTFYGMNATSGAVSALTANSLSLSGASTSFLMGNGSLNTTNYNYRKFSMISSVTLDTLQTNTNMIGTMNPSTGNVFTANEAKIGDVYALKVYGTVWNPS
jgi:hypothetical protein